MSLEAWGDEDPTDSLCAVPGCECRRRAGYETCEEHAHWHDCTDCYTLIDPEYWPHCDECHAAIVASRIAREATQ